MMMPWRRKSATYLQAANCPTAADTLQIDPSDETGRWIVRSGQRQFALLQRDDGWRLAHWDDWYEYPGTYWKDGNRRGVDRGEPSRLVYFLQLTDGASRAVFTDPHLVADADRAGRGSEKGTG